jgi:hypothetical protein
MQHQHYLMQEHQNLKCLVSFWLCKMIVLTGYTTRWNKRQNLSISRWSRTFYSQCSCNRFLHSWNKWNIKWYCSYVESINDTARYVDQGGGKRKGSLLSISKLGMQMFLISWIWKKIQERRDACTEIYSACGLLICLWKEFRKTEMDVNVS